MEIIMKKRVIAIICIAFIVAGCALLAVYEHIQSSVPENPAGTVGNTSGNLYNGGLFCENDGYVYFSNAYDSGTLYRMLPDESAVEKLSSASVSSINADGKFLYFYQSGSSGSAGLGYLINSYGVFRMAKEKADNISCLDRVLGQYVILADNTVYYTSLESDVSLMSLGTDGSDKEMLLQLDILPVSVQDSTFYYINNTDNLHLMALDLNTKTSRQVLSEDVYMPIIEGNTVYGIDIHDNYSLISLDISTGEKTLLDSDRTDMLNVTDSYIYYQTSGETPQLKRIRRDGSDMEIVMDGAYSNINATSRYVYFTDFNSDVPVYRTSVSGAVSVAAFDAASDAALEEISGNDD
ncbi:MAG: DUF5050 domain-containing protein [Lachnospiraceae bacterium]|nr:DUF5050 domain-containing protein [Lachnospiraceae bacterium]